MLKGIIRQRIGPPPVSDYLGGFEAASAGFDKPMIHYPMATLMLADIRDILIITTPEDQPLFRRLLRDRSQWGVWLSFAEQPVPGGLPQALLIGRDFIGSDPSCLILGDNVFYGHGLPSALRRASSRSSAATVFAYRVNDPERYGVVEFDEEQRAVSIEQKPQWPRSNFAVTGRYFYGPGGVGRRVDAVGAWRAGDHRSEPALSRTRRSERRAPLTRVCLVRYRNTGVAAQGGELRRAGRAPARIENRLPRAGCAPSRHHTADDVAREAARLRKSSCGEYLLRVIEQTPGWWRE